MRRAPDFRGDDHPNLLSLHIDLRTACIILGIMATGIVTTEWTLWDMRQKIKDGTGDRWTKSHQREWGHRLRDLNEGKLKVPDADEIARSMGE